MNKLSVVISAYNAESKIEETLHALKNFADEIIFVNNSSTDSTRKIAEKYTKNIFDRPNNPMLNVNKNFGFTKANNSWILNLDHDEVVTDELKNEIQSILKSSTTKEGYYIPRKNIIFGKWIEHTGWYPDYQLRFFRKNKGKFAEKHVHELLTLEGEAGYLENPMIHYNYETITQFLSKMTSLYTASEAENLIKSGYKIAPQDALRMPFEEFLRRFFAQKGYKDGLHGLTLSLLMAFYHLVVFMRVWELEKYKDIECNSIELLAGESKNMKKDLSHWIFEAKNAEASNALQKIARRIKRKITS